MGIYKATVSSLLTLRPQIDLTDESPVFAVTVPWLLTHSLVSSLPISPEMESRAQIDLTNFQQPSSHDRVHFLLRLVMVLLISK